MADGTVRFVKANRGFGFIKPAGGGPDVFFHCLDLADVVFDERLMELAVQFDLEDSPKGPRAVNVRPAGT